jgi:hypothetical protein
MKVYIIGFIIVFLLACSVIMLVRKKSNKQTQITSDVNVNVDVNNSVAVKNSTMAKQALKRMLSGNQEPMPYGINEKDKLY